MSKTVVVTTSSLNHIAQAKGLCESVLKYNPGYSVMIGLVDRVEGRLPQNYLDGIDIVEAHTMNVPEFEQMRDRYDVFELNCALKIFFAEHAFKKYSADKVIFLDSDMLIFDSLDFVVQTLNNNSVLLTPHILSPFPVDNKRPFEREMLKNGIYNGGFFAIRNDPDGRAFMDWWKSRMIDQCYVDLKHGMFVDQKWLNLAPIFFKQVELLNHPGCNTAYWNLHERVVSKKGEKFFVNEQPLLFYHYSGYSMEHPDQVSRHQDRIQMDDQPALQEIFSIYQQALIRNKHSEMLKLECYYKKSKTFLQKVGLKK